MGYLAHKPCWITINNILYFHLEILLLILLLPNVLGSSPIRIAKPGCNSTCGNTSIPYPFGFGKKCYHNPWFDVECVGGSKFMLKAVNVTFDVEGWGNHPTGRQINWVEEKTLTLDFQCTGYAFDPSDYPDVPPDLFAPDLRNSPFSYMGDRNILLVAGCGEVVFKNSRNEPLTGCATLCHQNKSDQFQLRHCYGVGCCQAALPFSVNYISIGIFMPSYDVEIATTVILVDKHFISNKIIDPKLRLVDCPVPVVVEWAVKDLPVLSPAYRNSTCVYKGAAGYVCHCKGDYKGNLYLPYGCQGCFSLGNDSFHCREDINKEYQGSNAKESPWLIVVLGLGTGVILLLFFCGVYWINKVMNRRRETRLKAQNFKRNGGMVFKQLSSEESQTETARIFTSTELANVTDNYNKNRILGHGGQAIVYKGMLWDGKLVAVKKLKSLDASQLADFINEVNLLSQINHRNIVKLEGCCLETEIPILVYEYVPNGTLSENISSPNEEFPCTWDMRLQIAIDVANGLAYLHSSSLRPIFHRDIKATNILLDSKYRAKLADFGISRSIDIDQTHVTTRVMGTFGYLDPEYFESQQFTDKSDVYSFGVVLVELLTGQLAGHSKKDERGLVPWFKTQVQSNLLNNILDGRVAREGGQEKVRAVAELATRCLILDRTKRPSMKEVEATLQTIRSAQEGWQNNLISMASMTDDAGISMTGDTTFRRFNRFGSY